MTTSNFLPERNQIVNLETGDWSVSGGSFAVANLTSAVPLKHSFLITPTGSGTVTLTLANIVIPTQHRGTPVQFYARVKTAGSVRCNVELLSSETELEDYVKDRQTRVGSNTWTTIRSNIMYIPDVTSIIYANLSITFTEHAGLPFYFTTPFMYATFEAFSYPFTTSTYAQLPEVLISTEDSQINEGYLPELPLFRLIEAGLGMGDSVFQNYFDFENVDEEDAALLDYEPTPSTLVDPDGITDANAKWLAQILGFRLDDPQQQTTPWGGLASTWGPLMTAIDATGLSANATSLVRSSNSVTATFASATGLSVNDVVSVTATDGSATTFSGTFTITAVTTSPSHTATWAQTDSDETASETHLVALVDTSWSELEESNPDYFDKATYTSWQVEYGYSGLHAGTRTALIDAAKFNLSGDKVVTITNNYSSSPWRILVTTKTSETPGGVINTENETILAAINRVKPVGFKLSHTCTTSGA